MFDVQMFSMVNERHLAKEFNKREAEGWQMVQQAWVEHGVKSLVVTWWRANP